MKNQFFNYFSHGQQQDLGEDLLIEAIRIHGIDVKYLPRTIVNQDFIFNEDPLGTFDNAVEVEVYIKNVQAFEGQGDFLSKFGVETRDKITFTMARKRWTQIRTEKLAVEVGANYQLETANTSAWGNTESYLLEDATANGYSISSSRPLEGDVIYFPPNGKLYEVKFVEHENVFYQFGKLYTYDLICESYERDNRLLTGNTVIDTIGTSTSLDVLVYQFTMEDGSTFANEDGGYILQEYRIETTAPQANNEAIRKKADVYVDWSENNPFSEGGRY